ncbi:MAG: DUF6062 family protein [Oscillospiraceae bacterium]|jgi:hypothetical protein
MRESILTIPVSEVFEPKCGCPICRMRDMLESRCVEYIMGAAMMEPDVRIETNRLGFCKTHFEQMMKQKNRLSLALMLQTHLKDVEQSSFLQKSFFGGKKSKLQRLSAVNSDCFVCSKIDWGMQRILVTVFEMFKKSDEFRLLFSQQEMLCLPHYSMLTACASEHLTKGILSDFEKSAFELTKNYFQELIGDVSHYCNMYDYRNSGADADWGNSKDSIERAIKFLTTR